jgi:hypothetical protein
MEMLKLFREFSDMLIVRAIINLLLMELTEDMLEIVSICNFADRAKRVFGIWFWKANKTVFFTS